MLLLLAFTMLLLVFCAFRFSSGFVSPPYLRGDRKTSCFLPTCKLSKLGRFMAFRGC